MVGYILCKDEIRVRFPMGPFSAENGASENIKFSEGPDYIK